MTLTKDQKEIVYLALSMRKCFIETGDPVISSADAERMGKKVKSLQICQMKLLIQIDDIMKEMLK